MRRWAAAVALASVVLGLSGCGQAPAGRSSSEGPATGTVTVLAAASLTEAFTTLAHDFERQHPGTKVVLSFGPSSGLAQQVVQGAPADVFASASATTMRQVVDAAAASTPHDFARNVLEIAVPPANPAGVSGLSDLANAGVKVALCQPQVPCGVVAGEVLRKAGVAVQPVTQEADVKAVLSKVALGEVDAGLVYATDVRAAGATVRGVEIPERLNASTTYPIAALAAAPNPAGARAFVDLVLSDAGRAALADAGFQGP
ncbi:molybdate ABC transporter substrate-binding protein [Angustibacter sp. Root456]|uniref:molybdate ABC transporter substrate-binding protein n=1 Tax=Angustibacter sp. Root456 TaxID=1736539 RepID=UPI0006F4E140|nr:molybdate ABC transporter substrate-binding protein [Angustibacter sp. Root456]KQX62849.1 molybdate-binding protein [Angustibacter sp. Root456]